MTVIKDWRWDVWGLELIFIIDDDYYEFRDFFLLILIVCNHFNNPALSFDSFPNRMNQFFRLTVKHLSANIKLAALLELEPTLVCLWPITPTKQSQEKYHHFCCCCLLCRARKRNKHKKMNKMRNHIIYCYM